MPFVGPDPPELIRKRRWHNEDDSQHLQPNLLFLAQHQDRIARKILPLTKRTRLSGDEVYTHGDTFTSPRRQRKILLTPCHICHRRPTKKTDLDSFAECEGCNERTCFICIRQCQGWNVEDESVFSDQEALSRSFCMDDADDEDAAREGLDGNAQRGYQTDDRGPAQEKQGWDAGGHRSVVCSRCCVERGVEGDVACLGCLTKVEAA